MRGLRLAVAFLASWFFATSAPAQNAIQQSGVVVPFHAGAWFGNGVLADAGTPQAPFISALGLFNGANCPLGVSSQTGAGLLTNPYAQFSVCQTSTATTLQFLGVNGQATPAVFFNVGGTLYPFPGPGNGDVLGPNSSTVGATVCFASTNGKLIAECNYQSYAGTLNVNTSYLFPTAFNPQAATLPLLSSVPIGTWVESVDKDDNAGTNNITFTASGSDKILDHASSSSTFVQNISNTIAKFIATASGWRVIVYGS